MSIRLHTGKINNGVLMQSWGTVLQAYFLRWVLAISVKTTVVRITCEVDFERNLMADQHFIIEPG